MSLRDGPAVAVESFTRATTERLYFVLQYEQCGVWYRDPSEFRTEERARSHAMSEWPDMSVQPWRVVKVHVVTESEVLP